jgi:hypothetical protein
VLLILFASFLAAGSDMVCIIFADIESQYDQYEMISLNSPRISHLTSVKIVNAHFYHAETSLPSTFLAK